MIEKENNKSLVIVKNNIWLKIRKFFKKIFKHKEEKILDNKEKNIYTMNNATNNKKQEFIDRLKDINTEEYYLLKLQEKYRDKEIEEKDLSEAQINLLNALYDKQIQELKRSNEKRRKKIMQMHG